MRLSSLLLLIGCFCITGCTDEINSYEEYGFLQAFDTSAVEKSTSVTVVQKESYYLAVIPCAEDERVFVLLNPKHEPLYKQIGQFNYELSHLDVSFIARECPKLDPTVRECLLSHVTKSIKKRDLEINGTE